MRQIILLATIAALVPSLAEARSIFQQSQNIPQARYRPGGYRWTAQRVNGLLNRRMNRDDRRAVWRAKMETRGELGHDGLTHNRVFNYTFSQLKRKLKILKTGSFTRPERRRMILSGWLDYHPDRRIPSTPAGDK